MPRAIWSGAISFGLINIPVKLFSAVQKQDVQFHELHDADGARLQHKRICPVDGEEVAYEHVVRGFEVSPGQHVIIHPDELNALEPKARRTIEVQEFVSIDEIDPIYYQRPYYLVPDKNAEKPYALLTKAMASTGRVAVARFVMRTKEYFATIRAVENTLNLSTMLYADEIRSTQQLDGLPDEDIKVNKKELQMAKELIESLAAEFAPDTYGDHYREKVLKLVEEKAKGKEVSVQPEVDAPAEVVDITAALEKSLAEARKKKSA